MGFDFTRLAIHRGMKPIIVTDVNQVLFYRKVATLGQNSERIGDACYPQRTKYSKLNYNRLVNAPSLPKESLTWQSICP